MTQSTGLSGDVLAPAGHPINTLMDEHRSLLGFAAHLKELAAGMVKAGAEGQSDNTTASLPQLLAYFRESASHYAREENVIFPSLEKHGITQPPAAMWMEHDRIRELEKELYRLVDTRATLPADQFAARLQSAALVLADTLASHFYKENHILFPMALQVIAEEEWVDLRRQCDGVGYCSFSPVVQPVAAPSPAMADAGSGAIQFATGALSRDQLELILNTLPIDITFVDEQDSVGYFSQSKDRIFLRTESIIGRTVQLCHPEKSIHVVNQILQDFRSGRRDHSDFWINLQGRLIHIRYFAVRDAGGAYRGCLEVTQDITDIQKITGERRLLD
jgi:uncharacterized protein